MHGLYYRANKRRCELTIFLFGALKWNKERMNKRTYLFTNPQSIAYCSSRYRLASLDMLTISSNPLAPMQRVNVRRIDLKIYTKTAFSHQHICSHHFHPPFVLTHSILPSLRPTVAKPQTILSLLSFTTRCVPL